MLFQKYIKVIILVSHLINDHQLIKIQANAYV